MEQWESVTWVGVPLQELSTPQASLRQHSAQVHVPNAGEEREASPLPHSTEHRTLLCLAPAHVLNNFISVKDPKPANSDSSSPTDTVGGAFAKNTCQGRAGDGQGFMVGQQAGTARGLVFMHRVGVEGCVGQTKQEMTSHIEATGGV